MYPSLGCLSAEEGASDVPSSREQGQTAILAEVPRESVT